MTNLLETRDDVTITYEYVVPENQQDSAFHTFGPDFNVLATLTYKDRTLLMGVNGEMRLEVPLFDADGEWCGSETIRYCDQLADIGINTDNELYKFTNEYQDYDVWQNNSWFEVWSPDNYNIDWAVYHEFYEAIDDAVEMIKDDSYWSNNE